VEEVVGVFGEFPDEVAQPEDGRLLGEDVPQNQLLVIAVQLGG
jgi:hypothetical protein